MPITIPVGRPASRSRLVCSTIQSQISTTCTSTKGATLTCAVTGADKSICEAKLTR